MSAQRITSNRTCRRVSHAALVCFSVSAIAFVACALGLFVNHYLTGSLAISGTAAVGLIYLAMGVLNLGYEDVTTTIEELPAESQPPDADVNGLSLSQSKRQFDTVLTPETNCSPSGERGA